MPFVSQALRYSMSPKFKGSITTDTILSTAATVFDLTKTNALDVPRTPACASVGTNNSVAYGYKVCALGPGGKETAATAEVTTAAGATTMSATAYQLITWMEVEGAEGYTIYRETGAGVSATGLIGQIGPDSLHTTAGYMAFRDTGITIINAAAAPSTDVSYVCNGELPHHIYVENLNATYAMRVCFVKAPNATVAAAKAELILEESVAAGTYARRYNIPRSSNRFLSASKGEKWLCIEGVSGSVTAYIEVA